MHPPHRPKRNQTGEKSVSILVKTFFFEATWIWAKKTFEFPISAEKSLSILVKTSEFLRFCASNPPPPKFSGSATGSQHHRNCTGEHLRLVSSLLKGLIRRKNNEKTQLSNAATENRTCKPTSCIDITPSLIRVPIALFFWQGTLAWRDAYAWCRFASSVLRRCIA